MKFKEKNNYYYLAFIEDIDSNKIEDGKQDEFSVGKKKSNYSN